MARIDGTNQNDANLNGTEDNDEIYGFAGRDTINALAGNDTVYGGSGPADPLDDNDVIYGGLGSDAIFANAGDDVVYGGRGQADTEDGGDTIYGGLGNDIIFSNAGEDVVYGGEGSDQIFGGNSNDYLVGGNATADTNDGADYIVGGLGNNIIFGNAGDDTLIASDAIGGGANDGNNVVYAGLGNDTVYGGNGNDQLNGNEGNDKIYIGSGSNRVDGGTGFDTAFITGAADSFNFSQNAETGDVTLANKASGAVNTFHDVESFQFNNNTTDTVFVPGDTVFVPVPGPTVVVDQPDIQVESFGRLDAMFTNANGGLFFGDGTTQASGQAIVTDPTSGITLALSEQPRQADVKYAPYDVKVQDNTAEFFYNLPSGSQDDANGSYSDRLDRGATNFTYTYGSSKETVAEFLTHGSLELKIDTDPSAANNFLTLKAGIAADGTIDFYNAAGQAVITDNGGNANAFANSQQINFFVPGGVANLQPGAQFTVELNAYNDAGIKLVGLTDTFGLSQGPFAPADFNF